MKTFLTEKHNIPEGATHYTNATVAIMFCWFKFESDKWYVMTENDSTWHACIHNEWKIYGAKPIPQTKEVEWENGDECMVKGVKAIWIANDWMDDTQCIVAKYKEGDGYVDLVFAANEFISKPETPEAKKEREELESAYHLYQMNNRIKSFSTVSFEEFKNKLPKRLEAWLAIIKETGYRVEK